EPGQIKLEELPYIREEEANALVEAIVAILIRDHGYKRAPGRPRKDNGAHKSDGNGNGNGESDWAYLYTNIHEGRELHDSLRDLAAKLIWAGTNSGAVINQLRALMEGSKAPKDDRWRTRVREIPDAVDSAVAKYGKQTDSDPPPESPPEEEPEQ